MKAVSVEKVIKSATSSFCAVYYENEYFTAPMHIHSEYELILIEKGEGHAFIGDMVYQMKPGDFMLIVSNLPHLWLSADEYYKKGTLLRSASVYSQFSADVFPSREMNLEEFKLIWYLLEESQKGVAFSGNLLPKIREKFRELPSLQGLNRLVCLYQILNDLAQCPFVHLASDNYVNNWSKEENTTVQRANRYINRHYQEEITLEGIAEYTGMNPSALCRYYKKYTGKKIFEYIAELRISYAIKLLTYRHNSIGQVAYDCGYNSISHFNRQFKRIVGKTPSEYCNHLRNISAI